MNPDFAQMGMATLIPGMQYLLDKMQHELDQMRNTLAATQQQPKRKRNMSAYWGKMTPEERSAEVKRRQAKWHTKLQAQRKPKAKANGAALHARDPRSPKHKAWLKKVATATRAGVARKLAKPVVKLVEPAVNGAAL
jgi:hypothetical protein